MTNQEAEKHEYRIDYEIIVDTYDEYEQAMGWMTYLQDHLNTPFKARYIENTKLSNVEPLKEIIVTDLSNSEDDSDEELEYFEARVIVQDGERILEVPLSEVEIVDGDEETKQAVGDWHFWKRAY